MLILGLSNSLELVVVSWVVWAFAMILVMGADSALLHDSLKALGREREFEKWAGRTFAVRSASIVVATLIGGVVAGEFGREPDGTLLSGVGRCPAVSNKS